MIDTRAKALMHTPLMGAPVVMDKISPEITARAVLDHIYLSLLTALLSRLRFVSTAIPPASKSDAIAREM